MQLQRHRKRRLDKIVALPYPGPSVLACGAWLKNTVCVTRGNEAYVSQLIGISARPRQGECSTIRLRTFAARSM